MAVAYDNTVSISGDTVTTLTTGAFTIGTGNTAGLLGLSVEANTISAITGSIGGKSASAITGTDSGTASSVRSMQFGVTAPPSGSQTATMSWTTATDAVLGVVTATGVDQTTPFNNGTFISDGTTSSHVTITSTGGDLTVDTVAETRVLNTAALSAPTQTQKWKLNTSGPTLVGAGSTGPGTGTTTHTWTNGLDSVTWASSGANFNQAPPPPIIIDYSKFPIEKLSAGPRSALA